MTSKSCLSSVALGSDFHESFEEQGKILLSYVKENSEVGIPKLPSRVPLAPFHLHDRDDGGHCKGHFLHAACSKREGISFSSGIILFDAGCGSTPEVLLGSLDPLSIG